MLALLEFSGSPLDIGKALGRFGAQAAHDHLIKSSAWGSVMTWRGSDTAAALRSMVATHFPRIEQELAGLAQGLQLDPDDVFLWNCRGDLWAMAPDGCTTVLRPCANQPRITHNEDGDPGFLGRCGIGLFAPDGMGRFASFVYPASLPGHTFAVTQSGLAMTVNNLRSRRVAAGAPRMVLTRAMLDQPTQEDAVALLSNTPRSGGFHLSLGQRGRTSLLSIEFNAAAVSVQSVQQPALHANHAIHDALRDLPQVITGSSLHRQQRGDAMLADNTDINPLLVLADQADSALPIYRNAPDDSDNENTMATADIHVGKDHIRWHVYEHPLQHPSHSLIDTFLA